MRGKQWEGEQATMGAKEGPSHRGLTRSWSCMLGKLLSFYHHSYYIVITSAWFLKSLQDFIL